MDAVKQHNTCDPQWRSVTRFLPFSVPLTRWYGTIEEQGCRNLCAAFRNSPLNVTDKLGLWNQKVHYAKTRDWSGAEFVDMYATEIAAADNGVDNNATGPMPWQQQDRHLLYTINGQDSRVWWYNKEYQEAQLYLQQADRTYSEILCVNAADAFGRGLHSRQDVSAHRSWPSGGNWSWFIAHPAWWDDWNGETNSGDQTYDVFWHWIYGYGDYDKWTGSVTQIASQNLARSAVESASRSAITQFAFDVRKTCVCKRVMLIQP